MACEYNADLCFIRPLDWGATPLLEEVGGLLKDLFKGSRMDLEPSEEEGLEVVVARVNGLAMWEQEDDLLDWLNAALPESWWIWLAGYQVNVMKKEDVGPCRLKGKGIRHGC
ncbi:hypothetical protein FHS18_003242 [Paenibacillus phyllosphaerae]|uniref:Uncharacterized protein n=1 Tax=Paenibacillus phyllosphaerae TaxID=274593 RepID=A0A7W5AZ77_9BACL|nr:hypothetical protein [Paenibacillus phyllosphaerae]MBB3111174.1 hypothetical protein [Paenibacillus phyllosphaerae]